MKKAQASNVIMYVLVIVVVAFILIFGFRAITKIIHQTSEIDLSNLMLTMQKDIKADSGYGIQRTHEYSVPMKVEEICFVNKSIPDSMPEEYEDYPLIWDSWADENVKENVFPMPEGRPFQVFDLEIGSPGILCIDNPSGTIKIRTRGLGDKTRVDEG